jgi:acyl carrier protein
MTKENKMSERETKSEKIRDLIALKFNISKEKIQPETNIFSELGADSLKMLGFISGLEKEFDIEIEDDDINELYCIENILKVIEKYEE